MFTDRFLKLPIELYNIPKAEMLGYNEDTKTTDSEICILPFELSHYRAAFDEGDETGTLIYMKNGDNFEISLSVEEFEKLLNLYLE